MVRKGFEAMIPEDCFVEHLTTVVDVSKAPIHLNDMSKKRWELVSVVLHPSCSCATADDRFQFFWKRFVSALESK